MPLSIISQSFFQPFSLEDNLLVILTALTSGSGVGFNRAMLFLKQGDRLKGEMWLGPRSAEEAGLIWEVLSTPGIGYVEIVEHNRALVNKNEDTLSARLKGLVYAADDESGPHSGLRRLPQGDPPSSARPPTEPLVDRRFLNLIGVEEFLCIPLLARDDVVGEIILDNAITRDADHAGRHQAGRRLRPDAPATTSTRRRLHRKLLDVGEDGGHGRRWPCSSPTSSAIPSSPSGASPTSSSSPTCRRTSGVRNLTIIRDEIRRLEDIIYQMGHFLKVSLKEPVYFDPGPRPSAAVLDSPEIQAKARDCALNVKLEPCLPEILCDPTSFGEVVRNLPGQRLRRDPRRREACRRARLPQEPGRVRPHRPATRARASPTRTRSSSSSPSSRPRRKAWAWACPSSSGSWTLAAARSRSRAGSGRGPCSSSSLSAAKRSRRHEKKDPARRGRESPLPALRRGTEPRRDTTSPR
ncbi:MAG: hypothetical protein MZV70_18475 [Desulfobacterales bacterium]|nr:hypothetical protein [Desulfobacterales bacterium]